MLPELVVSLVVVAVDSRFLDGPVHPLDLTVGPRMVGLGQAVLDTVGSADLVEAVHAVAGGPAVAISGQVGELNAVVGQDGVQAVGHGRDRKSGRVDDRRIMNAIFYVLRTGMPWRDLPERHGPYTTAYNRFNRWSRRGIWKRIFDRLASKSRDNLYLIDSTIVKAHRSASGAKGGRKTRPSASAAAGGARKSTPSSTAKAVRSTSSWQADKSMT